MTEEDGEILKTEEVKIQHLLNQLEDEERKYDEIAAELQEELEYQARIHEEGRKLKELKEEKKLNKPLHHWSKSLPFEWVVHGLQYVHCTDTKFA